MAEAQISVDPSISDLSSQLAFTRKLQAVTNKIHAAHNIDAIMVEVGHDIRTLLDAERITIYQATEDRARIISKVKSGLNAWHNIELPVDANSIAGHVALHREVVCVVDAYDESELARISPQIHFNRQVDEQTGFRTHQVLAAPIQSESGDLLGVVQIINTLSGMPFGEWARTGIVDIARTLAIAFEQRSVLPFVMRARYQGILGAHLSILELEQAAHTARVSGRHVEDVLLEDFRVPVQALGASLAQYFKTPYEPFRQDRIRPSHLLTHLKRDYVTNNEWLPLEEGPEGMLIVTTDPEQQQGMRMVAQIFPKARFVWRVTTRREFAAYVELFYGDVGGSIGELLSTLAEEEQVETDQDDSAVADNELVKLVNKIILDAYQQGASDIHIEPAPGKHKTRVRFRKDGMLVPYIEVPATYRNPMITRIKIMCDLDISEKRRPQDGKIAFKKFGPADIELRVATIPTAGGLEDVVMRILAHGKPIALPELGLSDRNYQSLQQVISKPYGLILVCGPTGSGKTTSLHSVLGALNQPDTKIWTAEDPVEITQEGLRQVQVNPKAGFTFAQAMRAFLRADPDVIMVGEMRDQETAATSVEASLTGHLVLSTLHTNSAPESVVRLLDMGMDPFNFADALLGVLAQRLARRLCSKCRTAYTPEKAELQSLIDEYSEELQQTPAFTADPEQAKAAILEQWRTAHADASGRFRLFAAKGCDACDGTGYKGRLGLHELLVGTPAIKKLILERAPVAQIVPVAINEGMRTLKQDGIEKVLAGLTDMKQVRSVCIK